MAPRRVRVRVAHLHIPLVRRAPAGTDFSQLLLRVHQHVSLRAVVVRLGENVGLEALLDAFQSTGVDA